ncbi:MAG: hypothetical protein E7019_02925 [Alphaproteobacteria bacterium]|nr:hypothetical protein [Alphaproteobacteria bacterium]
MNSTKFAVLSLWIAFTAVICFGSLALKNNVQKLENELNSINRKIKNDITDIHILKVEWSHLNSPSRLRNLASKHISLNPVQAEQIINYSALPFNHENSESRRIAARKSISNYAEHNRELKRLTRAQR